LVAQRPDLARRALMAFLLILMLLIGSYLVTYLWLGFGSSRLIALDRRTLDFHAPFTFTPGGTLLFEGAPPRFVLGTGEPGLNIFFFMAAGAFILSRPRSVLKWAGLAVLSIGVVASQSSGVFISVTAGLAVGVCVALVRRRRYVGAVL